MSGPRFPDEPLFVTAELTLRYRYGAGREAAHYLRVLKENMVFEGSHCPRCDRVYLPPRPVCAKRRKSLNGTSALWSTR